VNGYSGDAGDAMSMSSDMSAFISNGVPFSTPDVDMDVWPEENCAASYGLGWWMRRCSCSVLTFQGVSMWTTGPAIADVQTSHMMVRT